MDITPQLHMVAQHRHQEVLMAHMEHQVREGPMGPPQGGIMGVTVDSLMEDIMDTRALQVTIGWECNWVNFCSSFASGS